MSISNKQHVIQVYFKHGGTGSGASIADAAPLGTDDASVDLAPLPKGFMIESADVIVLTAVAGVSAMEIGDSSDPNGFVENASITLGTPGVYEGGGALIASGAKKLYTTADALNYQVTGTSSAGLVCVALKGQMIDPGF